MTRTKKSVRQGVKTKNADKDRSQSAKSNVPSTSTSSGSGSGSGPSAAGLVDKAHTLLAQSNFELAIQFLNRALEIDGSNTEARELVGVAELEGGDADLGRELFPPHSPAPPAHPSPYLYLAQCAESAEEALGYYSAAVSMLEQKLQASKVEAQTKSKGKSVVSPAIGADAEQEDEERGMAVTALVAMIEIWMSDLCFEPSAETNCESLIAKALALCPGNPEVQLALASIRMSQQKFEEAKRVILEMYTDIEGKEPFDPTLPTLPARLSLIRLLLEHALHLEALEVLVTVREEDILNVEGAYLEGWAYELRGAAILDGSATVVSKSTEAEAQTQDEQEDQEGGPERLTAEECFAESMGSLIEAAKLFTEQDYPDEGIGAHIKELLDELEKRGVKPALQDEDGEGAGGEWEDVDAEEEDGDVEMA